MEITKVIEKKIQGISTRTKNTNEMSSETAKIAHLYKRFDKNIVVDYKNGARVYGIYFDYESDATGEFSVLAGSDEIESSELELQQVTIQAGDYLVFQGKGEMPKAVIDTWMEIWNYFSTIETTNHQRAYRTDFEFYKSETEVDIYIGIQTS